MSDSHATAYVGQSVPRVNDQRLLTGAGRFVDDISLPGMVHASIIRSSVAHAHVIRVDLSRTRDEDGVVLALGPDDLGGALADVPCVWIAPGQRLTAVPVVSQTVRHVGAPLGIILAESRAHAEDGVDVVDVDYEPLPAVVEAEAALRDDAPVLYPEWGTNVCADFEVGDPRTEVEAVLRRAPYVIERRFRTRRVAGNPIETRGLVASWDPALDQLTVWISTQVPHHARDHIAHVLGLRADQVRVIGGDVGGGFGTKEHVYADELLVCHAAMRLNRPVKWIEDRSEHLVATFHARDAVHRARLALAEDGTFLALYSDIVGNLGAYPSNVGTGPFRISAVMLPGPYRFELAGARICAVVTTTTPTGAYRGFGMQEAAWVRERLIDEAARELDRDPAELRLANMLTPDELPFTTRTNQNYDSGDYPEALRRVVAMAEGSKTASDGPVRHGVGFATHVEFTGLGPSKVQGLIGFHIGGFESALVRMEPDGSVTVSAGVMGMGQGIETTLAQVAADRLQVSFDRVRVRLGDSAIAPYSAAGSIASRSITVAGGAVVRAAERLHAKLLRAAANQLEAAVDDIELANEVFTVRGSPDVALSLNEVAERAWLAWDVPEGDEPGLEERFVFDPPDISYAYAAHGARVSVDVRTGQVRIDDYWVCHDSGVLVNPKICDGQVVGGIAQGIGIALHEEMMYGPDGQPLTTTYLDYVLPLSADVPDIQIEHLCTPSPWTPGGMKGLGEGGTILSPVAVGNAIAAAVPEIAEDLVETPVSPSRLWSLIHQSHE